MERRAITVRGIVQGVGFRPFVYGLASRLDLRGFVRNQTGTVLIEVEGASGSLERFLRELVTQPPPLAQIDHVSWEAVEYVGDWRFRIDASQSDPTSQVFIAPDVATCPDCLAEMLDPADRRWKYPFLNCTNCGPRLTIITGAPYDRARTTMAGFAMCNACRAEYDDPGNRRFHAQPTACAECGPRLELLDAAGQSVPGDEPLAQFVAALRAGLIGALKGMGGYHLVCDARDEQVVARLRQRKHRDERPFAIMVQDASRAEILCELTGPERALLTSPRSPIVLLRKRVGCPVAETVAPRNPFLGVLLPYTPLHHLLVRAMGDVPLVMTSGNRSDEPIAHQDDNAVARLAGIADQFLVHNRPIHVRCDDSVSRIVDGAELPIRRSRGYAPQPIRLPAECPCPVLAVGGQLKATFALARDHQAFVSHHMGDLDHYEAFRAYQRDVVLYQRLFGTHPEWIAHDLHPDYASTLYAHERAAQEGLELIPVQHHHAHMASCMAEHGLTGTVIGVAMDGTGYGTDGAVWGGEFLVGGYRTFRRAAHLRYVGMPGGEQAIRQPWRMAVAHLADAQCHDAPILAMQPPAALRTIRTMLERRLNSPLSSSAGRLFDAVAAIAGLRDQVSYEGQAAIELEWLAMRGKPDGLYPFHIDEIRSASREPTLVIDTRPLIQAAAEDSRTGVAPGSIARRFHSTMSELIAAACAKIRQQEATLDKVVLSGGVFMNALLVEETTLRLRRQGFQVYRHHLVPPNDGGLCLGQLAVAIHQPLWTRSNHKGEAHVLGNSRASC